MKVLPGQTINPNVRFPSILTPPVKAYPPVMNPVYARAVNSGFQFFLPSCEKACFISSVNEGMMPSSAPCAFIDVQQTDNRISISKVRFM